MQAIILAAGMGKRLKELTQNNTKCMVKVNGITLIDRMLHQIEKQHLSRIVIVVGYEGKKLIDYIGTLGIKTPLVFVENQIYDKTNNIYSQFISLFKDSQKEGSIQLPLGQIVGSRGSTFKQKIGKKEFIIISAQGISDQKAYIEFNFTAQCLSYFDFSKISNRISYLITSNGRKIYSSESISSYGNFEPKKVPVALIDKGFIVS